MPDKTADKRDPAVDAREQSVAEQGRPASVESQDGLADGPMIARWVRSFIGEGVLSDWTREVLEGLPAEVRRDVLGDRRFVLSVYRPGATGHQVRLSVGEDLGGVGQSARGVSLRASLAETPGDFGRYVIAHEFAHAYLRHACASAQRATAVEQEADELAAVWGFAKPDVGRVRLAMEMVRSVPPKPSGQGRVL